MPQEKEPKRVPMTKKHWDALDSDDRIFLVENEILGVAEALRKVGDDYMLLRVAATRRDFLSDVDGHAALAVAFITMREKLVEQTRILDAFASNYPWEGLEMDAPEEPKEEGA